VNLAYLHLVHYFAAPLQANTTKYGEDCADWSLFTPTSELLLLGTGLYKNLCRNPDWDENGPWCFKNNFQKEYCDVSKCGGASSKVTSVVASFEGLAADTQEVDHVFARIRGNTMVSIDVSTSYCGRASAYFPKSNAQFNSQWVIDRVSKNPPVGWYNTAEFPYVCLAYKIPATSHVVMAMRFADVGWQNFPLNFGNIDSTPGFAAKFDVIAGWFAHSAQSLIAQSCLQRD
jgi:hypothetical protein